MAEVVRAGEAPRFRDNLASVIEALSDALSALDPDRAVLLHGDRRRTWAEFDDRAARLAGFLSDRGIGAGDRVGIGLYNSPEYLESLLAVLKLRAVPVNVNYRYREAELEQVLGFTGIRAVVADAALVGRMATVAARLPELRAVVVCDADGGLTVPVPEEEMFLRYEAAVAAAAPRPRQERSADDRILILTGGTTGLPKGVVWDCAGVCGVVSSAYGRAGEPVPADVAGVVAAAEVAVRAGTAPVILPASPLMHGTGFFFSLGNLLRGGQVVTLPQRSLDPAALWTAVQEHQVQELAIVGDAFAVPLLDEYDRAAAAGTPYDLGSLRRVVSSGVRWSTATKRRLLRAARATLQDSIAATEGGPFGISLSGPDPDTVTDRFTLPANARVIGPDGTDVVPGSGQVGVLASTGNLPLGYLDDPEATAGVFRVVDGVRYAVPGDAAIVAADGTLTLLGRGSGVINTGGEKVFAEEVEQALVEHPGVAEAVVVGVPDDRWGSRVTALVVPVAGVRLTVAELGEHVGSRLADYKRPRLISVVPEIERTVSGKIDRRWATDRAGQLAAGG
ncbi:AMP-binding protein [Geodermatophilus ruber]|uniref:Acyl-CoA synthetase (AMP-forming)/AMP-acid ligase II n=1 Tax=Geodermatophilus ruber TaxID=504800 RepID=A0A1I4HSP4_9ACTN|nr:AMP-binding protein [Geodermatophilus ruber]SFL44416.1 Acyl-CoA synthetase (AMP-forming)/AMP-acid ligase II [Geodermatophilus ruber]